MKKISKILAMVLALTMLFTLAACGKSENKPEATPAPETVYASEFKTFPGTYSGTNARLNVRYTDETGFYGMINEVVGQRASASLMRARSLSGRASSTSMSRGCTTWTWKAN